EKLADFEQIECSEGMLTHNTDGAFLLVATNADPQIFLPPVELPPSDSCRMEIELAPHGAPASVIAAAIAWDKTFDELSTALEASQAEIGRQTQALAAAAEVAAQLQSAQTRVATLETAVATWQRTFTDLQASFDASRAELGRATHHLKVKDAQIRTLQNSVAETHTRLSQLTIELSAERSENQQHQERARALEAALQSAMEQARADS